MNPAGVPVSGAAYGVGQAAGDLLVVQNGTPNMSVNVGAGHVWIDGTEGANQGAYHAYNDATKNLVVAASDPTNARKDLVVAKVQDAAYSGATNAWSLAVVTGTPAASPVEPAVPANAVVLAMINVAALSTTVTNANITDRRRRASALGGVGVCTSATHPAAPYAGQQIFETDNDHPMVWDGAAWKQLGLKYDPPACRVYHNTTQTMTEDTDTLVVFNTERFDTDTMHDTVTNNSRITFKTAGLYAVSFTAELVGGITYTRVYSFIRLNGATPVAVSSISSGAGGNFTSVTTLYKFAVNDYVEMMLRQQSTANRVLNSSANYSPEFSAVWVGRG